MDGKIELSSVEHDALKEIANVGAGHAAGGLSLILKRKVNLKISDVALYHIDSVQSDNKERSLLVIYTGIKSEDFKGNLLLAMPWECYEMVMKTMNVSKKLDSPDEFSEEIKQVGNQIFTSYSSALNQFLNANIRFMETHYVLTTRKEFISAVYDGVKDRPDYALLVTTGFDVEGLGMTGEFQMTFSLKDIDPLLHKVRTMFGL